MRAKKHLLIMIFTVAWIFSATSAMAGPPKFVFFFLGDGMASSQIQAAEAYLTTVNGGSASLAADLLKPENRLNRSKMPVSGMQTTYDAHALMTDSASSATAFSSGYKTLSGVIGMDEEKTKSCKSVAQLAHEKGKKVGVISSVSLDHATPAAYSANHITMFLLFMAKGLPMENLLNASFVSAEILNILVGSFGLVTVAPFTAIVSGFLYHRPYERVV